MLLWIISLAFLWASFFSSLPTFNRFKLILYFPSVSSKHIESVQVLKLEIVFDCLKLIIELALLSLFSSKNSSKKALILLLIFIREFFCSSSSNNLDFLPKVFLLTFLCWNWSSKEKDIFLVSIFSSFFIIGIFGCPSTIEIFLSSTFSSLFSSFFSFISILVPYCSFNLSINWIK